MASIGEDLDLIGIRLAEAWEAFRLERIINETANKDADPELNAYLGKHPAFWNVLFVSLRTTTFVGICALLEEQPKSATLYSVLREVRKISHDPVFSGMSATLDTIRARYEKYRHKLYAHNARGRALTIDEFDAEGFSWPGGEDDFRYLDFAWKALRCANDRRPIPSAAEALKIHYPHNLWVAGVSDATAKFLADCKSRI
jgi:hypothetical protein